MSIETVRSLVGEWRAEHRQCCEGDAPCQKHNATWHMLDTLSSVLPIPQSMQGPDTAKKETT